MSLRGLQALIPNCYEFRDLLIRAVKISNLSLGASARNLKEFFFSTGDIDYVEMLCDNEHSQIAFVTFKDAQGAESAVLLSGSTIVDLTVTITPAQDHQLPCAASLSPPATERRAPGGAESAFHLAEEVVNSILAKGYVLGKDTINRAKSFDEKHQLTSTTSTKVREVDQKLQVSEKVKSACLAAGQTVNSARFAIMKNTYIFKGASWVTGAFNKVAKAAGEVGQNTKGKLGTADEDPRRTMKDDSAHVHLSKSPKAYDGNRHSPSKSSLDKERRKSRGLAGEWSEGSERKNYYNSLHYIVK